MAETDKPIYDALALPSEALANGGVEILRAGVIDDELFVSARRAFKDPAQWGEVLADIAQRLGLLYAAETDLSEQEVIAAIESAFAAELGAPVVEETRPGARRGQKAAAKKAKAAKAKASKAKASKAKTSTAKTSAAKSKRTKSSRPTSSRAKAARVTPRAKRK